MNWLEKNIKNVVIALLLVACCGIGIFALNQQERANTQASMVDSLSKKINAPYGQSEDNLDDDSPTSYDLGYAAGVSDTLDKNSDVYGEGYVEGYLAAQAGEESDYILPGEDGFESYDGVENETGTESEPDSVIVYVTDQGAKYHSAGCRYLSQSRNEISLDAAKSQGYAPCSVCNPPT